jgi:pimeloyl-ACP methyl ester carboxylesterase
MIFMSLSCNMDGKPSGKSPINIPPSSLATPVSPIKIDPKGKIKTSWGEIYYEDSGEGGVPVIFVHSFGGSTLHWGAQVNHLKKNRRVITLDLRGHGRSDAPKNMDYTVDSLATDIAAVVDSLNINQFVLVGHSMGGAAVIAYAGAHPQRVAGLLMAGTSGKSSEKEAKPIIASLESKDYDKRI